MQCDALCNKLVVRTSCSLCCFSVGHIVFVYSDKI